MTDQEEFQPRLSLYEDGWTGDYQIAIEDDHGGQRLLGPKFNGSSTLLRSKALSKYDLESIIREAQRWLDVMGCVVDDV